MNFRPIFFTFLCIKFCLCSCVTALSDNERLEQLEEVVANIMEKLEEKDTRIKQLENIVNSHEESINSLKQTLQAQEQIIEFLKNSNDQSNKSQEQPSVEIPQIENPTKNKLLHKTFPGSRVQSSIKPRSSQIRRAENENSVAFLAGLTAHSEHMGAMQNIAFDDVITNVGMAYNSHAGVFIAPVPGIYVFSTTLMSYGPNTDHFHFLKNGSPIANLFHQTDNYETTSMTLVLELEQGDDVSVANGDADQTVHGALYNTFCGFLLQQYYSK